MNHHGILISDGGELKSLGDGRIGGWAVVYGDETKTDKSRLRDFMTAETDYWIDDDQWGVASSPVIFHHGLDPDLKKLRLGRVTYTKKDAGIWAEGVLKLRADYEAKYRDYFDHIKAMVEAGKLGLSTGVPGHLVERERRGESHWLKVWPIERSELSLTPTPAEPRTSVFSLKSLLEFESSDTHIDESTDGEGAAAAPSLADDLKRLAADARRLCALTTKAADMRRSEGRDLSSDKRDAVKAVLDEHRELLAEIERLAGMKAGAAPEPPPPAFDPDEFRAIIERGRKASQPNRMR